MKAVSAICLALLADITDSRSLGGDSSNSRDEVQMFDADYENLSAYSEDTTKWPPPPNVARRMFVNSVFGIPKYLRGTGVVSGEFLEHPIHSSEDSLNGEQTIELLIPDGVSVDLVVSRDEDGPSGSPEDAVSWRPVNSIADDSVSWRPVNSIADDSVSWKPVNSIAEDAVSWKPVNSLKGESVLWSPFRAVHEKFADWTSDRRQLVDTGSSFGY